MAAKKQIGNGAKANWEIALEAQEYKVVTVRTNPKRVTAPDATYYDPEQRKDISRDAVEVFRTPLVAKWLKNEELLEGEDNTDPEE